MTTQNPANRPRALIAMSGGVDSSVAACLMQQAGYDCTGITMRLTHNETLGQSGYQTCCSEKDIEDAAEVAFALDMPYQVLDFTADFRAQIIEKFIRVYEAGGTPNPCIDCNKYMKFRHLLDWAEEHGMEYVVTGHYARVEQDAATGRWLLKKGLDEGKDQSYVLYNLTQEQLAHTLTVIRRRMRENGQVVVAVEPNPASEQMQLRALRTADGASWWYAFTSFEEEMKGAEAVQSTFLVELEKLLDAALQVPEIQGIILNPWNRTIQLDKTLLRIIKG